MLVATQPIARPSSGFGGVSEMVHYLLGVVRNYVGTYQNTMSMVAMEMGK